MWLSSSLASETATELRTKRTSQPAVDNGGSSRVMQPSRRRSRPSRQWALCVPHSELQEISRASTRWSHIGDPCACM
jgi:hypothetical protein